MNPAHLHLLLNHVPVLGTLFGVALVLLAMRWRSRDLEAAALWVFLATAIAAVPVYLTGEPAEEVVESLPGVTEAAIEEHEEAALMSLWAVETLGLIALAGLILGRGGRTAPRVLRVATLVVAVAAAGLMAWTANLGGQVRHTEIRPASLEQPPSGPED